MSSLMKLTTKTIRKDFAKDSEIRELDILKETRDLVVGNIEGYFDGANISREGRNSFRA